LKKLIAVVIVIGLFWGLHYINPSFDDHKSAISPDSSFENELWDELVYKDYYIISFTNSAKGTMVSFGLTKYVNVVDKEWGLEE